MDALATQIDNQIGSRGTADPLIDNLQVDGRLVPNPTVPAIDIYPGDPFQEAAAYGRGNNEMFFTIRARVSTSDNEAGQDLLLSLMDPQASTSVAQAVLANRTLGSVVEKVGSVEGPSQYGLFGDPNGANWLGCTWRVRIFP
jgi:hypothetical protein